MSSQNVSQRFLFILQIREGVRFLKGEFIDGAFQVFGIQHGFLDEIWTSCFRGIIDKWIEINGVGDRDDVEFILENGPDVR